MFTKAQAVSDQGQADLRHLASASIREQVEDLVQASQEDLSWLPDDFAQEIAALAWDHQFDISEFRFKKGLKSYISSIAEPEEA